MYACFGFFLVDDLPLLLGALARVRACTLYLLCSQAITTVTLIIGSVVYLKPTEVSRVPFTRDLVFLALALLLILISTSIGSVSVSEGFRVGYQYVFWGVFFFRNGQVYLVALVLLFTEVRFWLVCGLVAASVFVEGDGALGGTVPTCGRRRSSRLSSVAGCEHLSFFVLVLLPTGLIQSREEGGRRERCRRA